MTYEEALEKAEWCLDTASDLDKDPMVYANEEMLYFSQRNLMLVEAGKGYIMLARELKRGN